MLANNTLERDARDARAPQRERYRAKKSLASLAG